MIQRYRERGKKQEDDETNELLGRVKNLVAAPNVCDLVSELISPGVEKCTNSKTDRDHRKDLCLVVSHALSNVPWSHIIPPFVELGF